MPAYVVADVKITDPDGYEEYRAGVPATIAAHGGRYLARGGATEVLEGEASPNRMVIVEFPTMTQLKAWYDSPDYKPLREIRNRTATTNLVVIEGV